MKRLSTRTQVIYVFLFAIGLTFFPWFAYGGVVDFAWVHKGNRVFPLGDSGVTASFDSSKKTLELRSNDVIVFTGQDVASIAWGDGSPCVAVATEGKIVLLDLNNACKKIRDIDIGEFLIVHMEFHEGCVLGWNGYNLNNNVFSVQINKGDFNTSTYKEITHSHQKKGIIPYEDGMLLVQTSSDALIFVSPAKKYNSVLGMCSASKEGFPQAVVKRNKNFIVITDRMALLEFDPAGVGPDHPWFADVRTVEPSLKMPVNLDLLEQVGDRVYLIDRKSAVIHEVDFEKQTIRSLGFQKTIAYNDFFIWNSKGLYLVSDKDTELILTKEKLDTCEAQIFKWKNSVKRP